MIYTDLTKKAMTIAYNAHMGQFDKCGMPYVFHPMHLAEQMETEYACIVALLHDVVEDTNITFDDLQKEFPKEVIDALKLLTHDETVEYLEYVKHIKHNEIARSVKIADLTHNSDLSRFKKEEITEKDLKRAQKYKNALQILK